MAKIIFLISIMLVSSCLTEQAKSSDGKVNGKNNKVTNTLKTGEYQDPNSVEHVMLSDTSVSNAAIQSRVLYQSLDPRYVSNSKISKEFDARKHWPKCKTIGEVHNDGNQKSNLSWAYATSGAFADRVCIATNGSYNQLLSTEELISCSGISSGNYYYSYIDQMKVWEYFKYNGLVSGGKYNTNDGCQPSKISPICNLPKKYVHSHTCDMHCYGNITIDYNHDHVKVSHIYSVAYENIQREVQVYGPISAAFALYDDFFLYNNGIYEKTEKSKFVRHQYAKLIGWGVEDGVDYWLLINSWGVDWGQNGLFKIRRGTNECGIDKHTYGGVPEYK